MKDGVRPPTPQTPGRRRRFWTLAAARPAEGDSVSSLTGGASACLVVRRYV